jgi:NhaP-type Na+/H+ and K+/H+ antiporter
MSSNNVIRKKSKIAGGFSSLMSVLAIVISLIAGVLIYKLEILQILLKEIILASH